MLNWLTSRPNKLLVLDDDESGVWFGTTISCRLDSFYDIFIVEIRFLVT